MGQTRRQSDGRFAQGARRGLRLSVANLSFYVDDSLDGVRHETVFFGLLENTADAREIFGRSNNNRRFENDLGDLITAALDSL